MSGLRDYKWLFGAERLSDPHQIFLSNEPSFAPEKVMFVCVSLLDCLLLLGFANARFLSTQITAHRSL